MCPGCCNLKTDQMHYAILLSNFQPGSINSVQLFQNADETHFGTRSKTAAVG